jgi:hypothetical protein
MGIAVVRITHPGTELPGTVETMHATWPAAYAAARGLLNVTVPDTADLDTCTRGTPPQVGLRVRLIESAPEEPVAFRGVPRPHDSDELAAHTTGRFA